MRGLLLASALLASVPVAPAAAGSELFGVRLPSAGLVVEVPYTLGTHHEQVAGVDGTVRLDPETLRVEGGRLVVPLADFHSDDAKRGCHLREALGLDYARSSFPREHVCDDRNRLPVSGPDAIAFPEIVLQLSGGGPTEAPSVGGPREVELEATLTLHGVSRPVRLHLTAEPVASPKGAFRVRGRVPLHLTDFGVEVKPANVLFVSISVRDEVTVLVDALLEPVAAR